MISCQSSHVIGYELIKSQIGEPSQPVQAAWSSLRFLRDLYSPTTSPLPSSDSWMIEDSIPFPTHQARGSLPGTDWQLDFTHIPTIRCAKYLLVLVDTFSGWVEAFPTTNKRAQTVSDLLQEIIPPVWCPSLSPIRQWSRIYFPSFSNPI